ncbi:MAG: extracellular solute-binding protein [Deltaproteobacteria bacterium]|nr:extracellular solute-binding protein [Deltaproteobacteria bacterium]
MVHWYVNPDNGGQLELAEKCSVQGKFRLEVSVLPNDATQQREQLVRRLAAEDRSIDLMSLDPPFVAELANAGFLMPFDSAAEAELSDGVLEGALGSARWNGRLVAAPFWANTQLLWYRKSIAKKAGLELEEAVTWSELIGAALQTGTTVEVQGRRYEGYMVWINALVQSAGGSILVNPQAGKDAIPGIDSEAGRAAAGIIRELARSRASNPALSTADEEVARLHFQSERGGFMVNWPYVFGAAGEALAQGSLTRETYDDIGWARYPRVVADRPSRPPLGGIHIAISAHSQNAELALEAVRCITSAESQKQYVKRVNVPAARASVYDDPEVKRAFPMSELVRESLRDAGPRPLTPYYTDVSVSVVRTFHPPSSVDPESTPGEAAELIAAVLHDLVLL